MTLRSKIAKVLLARIPPTMGAHALYRATNAYRWGLGAFNFEIDQLVAEGQITKESVITKGRSVMALTWVGPRPVPEAKVQPPKRRHQRKWSKAEESLATSIKDFFARYRNETLKVVNLEQWVHEVPFYRDGIEYEMLRREVGSPDPQTFSRVVYDLAASSVLKVYPKDGVRWVLGPREREAQPAQTTPRAADRKDDSADEEIPF